MMPRINVEESWRVDPRRKILSELLGDEDAATGCAERFWRLAQEFPGGVIPKDIFELSKRSQEFLKAKLAREVDGGYYVAGTKAHHEWLFGCAERGRRGGIESAKRPRDEMGRLLPRVIQGALGQTSSKSKPSSSSSSSSSSSKRKNKNISSTNVDEGLTSSKIGPIDPTPKQQIYSSDFLAWYGVYPKKEGKFRAAKLWAKLSAADRLAALDGVKRYAGSMNGRDPRYLKHADTFLSQRFWESEFEAGPSLPDPAYVGPMKYTFGND